MTKDDVKSFCSMGEDTHGCSEGFWQVFYRWCVDFVWESRQQLQPVSRLPAKEGLLGMLAYPIFHVRDPMSCKIVPTSNPSKYFNLLCRGKPGSANKERNTVQRFRYQPMLLAVRRIIKLCHGSY